jgi:hypothetical protein
MTLVSTPYFLAAGDKTFFSSTGHHMSHPKREHNNRGDLADYQKWSEALPDWAFLYLAPIGYDVSSNNETKIGTQPLVLHKGQIYLFVRPVQETSRP